MTGSIKWKQELFGGYTSEGGYKIDDNFGQITLYNINEPMVPVRYDSLQEAMIAAETHNAQID